MIYSISRSQLQEDFLRENIYPALRQTRYWSPSWDPDLYIDLARAGFISITLEHPTHGAVLLAELQSSYAVLDWENLHCSRKLRKLLRSGRLEDEGIELRITDSCMPVLERLLAYHGQTNWIHSRYRALLRQLERAPSREFALHGVELWCHERQELIAGELGYSLGSIYTSLSGFCLRQDPRWRHFGTLQMFLLAERLRDGHYAFWNLGHPQMAYKVAMGARIVERGEFLERFLSARDGCPTRPLTEGAVGKRVS